MNIDHYQKRPCSIKLHAIDFSSVFYILNTDGNFIRFTFKSKVDLSSELILQSEKKYDIPFDFNGFFHFHSSCIAISHNHKNLIVCSKPKEKPFTCNINVFEISEKQINVALSKKLLNNKKVSKIEKILLLPYINTSNNLLQSNKECYYLAITYKDKGDQVRPNLFTICTNLNGKFECKENSLKDRNAVIPPKSKIIGLSCDFGSEDQPLKVNYDNGKLAQLMYNDNKE